MIKVKAVNMDRAKKLFNIAPKEVKKSEVAAIRRATTRVKKMTSVEVRKRYIVKARDVKSIIKTKVIIKGASVLGTLDATGGSIPLENFKVSISKDPKKQIKARVKKGNALRGVRGLFRQGDTLLYRPTEKRYPLKRPQGPSIPQMIGNPEVVDALAKEAQRVFSERFDHEVKYRLSKLIGG